MDVNSLKQKTFASWIPTCAECGGKDVTVTIDFTTGKPPTLPCGHQPHFRLIPNPDLDA